MHIHSFNKSFRSSTRTHIPTERSLNELEQVQQRLDELEHIVLSHPSNLVIQEEEPEDDDDDQDIETIMERPPQSIQYRKPSEPIDKLAMKRTSVIESIFSPLRDKRDSLVVENCKR